MKINKIRILRQKVTYHSTFLRKNFVRITSSKSQTRRKNYKITQKILKRKGKHGHPQRLKISCSSYNFNDLLVTCRMMCWLIFQMEGSLSTSTHLRLHTGQKNHLNSYKRSYKPQGSQASTTKNYSKSNSNNSFVT
jgi:hypothetical protein